MYLKKREWCIRSYEFTLLNWCDAHLVLKLSASDGTVYLGGHVNYSKQFCSKIAVIISVWFPRVRDMGVTYFVGGQSDLKHNVGEVFGASPQLSFMSDMILRFFGSRGNSKSKLMPLIRATKTRVRDRQ